MWYRGTADAIYQNIYLLDQERPRYVLILSGDHVYSMDYRQMIAQHEETGADLTIGCIEVPREEAKRFGVMEVDASLRIRSFAEKPADPKPIPGKPDRSLASMGIYVFTTETLVRSLIADARRADSQHDFGKNVIPALVEGNARVYAHPFHEPGRPENNYWRDIGTLESYYAANMDLLEPEPPFRLDDPDWPVRTYYLPAPPARVVSEGQEAVVENSMLSPGAVVRGATVRRSILGPNVVLEPGAVVEDSLIFEGTRVGKGAQVRRTIIDKQVVVPPGDRIGGQPRDRSRGFKITESGLVVIPKGMVLA
ncbi:MAG: hypothetical protein KatS3mg115_1856 [Candidatus Poribacteria bacterium]|nr:MAG: hypothetical protein KatS3mg115_1856 [Candidatus Poribacteria bacterium]